MEGQLQVLVRLQELELAIKRFEEGVAAKPQELDPLTRARDETRTSAAKQRQELDEIDRRRRRLESEITQEQYNLERAQRKLHEVKTNKEYAAMSLEIEAFKQKIADHEDAVLQLMELAELGKQQSQELDRQISQAEEKLAEARRRNEAELAVLQNSLAEKCQRRDEAMRQLDRPMLDLYVRLLTLRKGLAVVGIKNGTCQGCFLALPPQLIQEVRRNDRVLTCSHCHRILYWSGEAQPSPSESGASELVR